MKNPWVGNIINVSLEPCFIVAEIGVNHNGSLELAKKLIKAAKEAGADAVKFQTWNTENIILKDVEQAKYQKENLKYGESQYEMLKKLELSYQQHFELKEIAEKLGLIFFSTMEDRDSVDFLMNNLKIPIIKVGSGDLTNYSLLRYTAKFEIPMVLSTGMATISEIDKAICTILNEKNDNIILLQCTSAYPCSYEDVNLRVMNTLKDAFKFPVGLSDHSLGIECAVASVALGGKYIEKHFTLSHNLPGPDHKASLEPSEFKKMVDAVRNVEQALGDGIKRPMPSELENRDIVRRKIVASKYIKAGDLLDEGNVTFKRSNKGLDAKYYELLIGQKAKTNIRVNEVIKLSDLE